MRGTAMSDCWQLANTRMFHYVGLLAGLAFLSVLRSAEGGLIVVNQEAKALVETRISFGANSQSQRDEDSTASGTAEASLGPSTRVSARAVQTDYGLNALEINLGTEDGEATLGFSRVEFEARVKNVVDAPRFVEMDFFLFGGIIRLTDPFRQIARTEPLFAGYEVDIRVEGARQLWHSRPTLEFGGGEARLIDDFSLLIDPQGIGKPDSSLIVTDTTAEAGFEPFSGTLSLFRLEPQQEKIFHYRLDAFATLGHFPIPPGVTARVQIGDPFAFSCNPDEQFAGGRFVIRDVEAVTAVPEPSSVVMLALGTMGLLAFPRRRKLIPDVLRNST